MIYRIAEEVDFLELAHMRWDFTLDGRNLDEFELNKEEFLKECVDFFRDATNKELWSHLIAVENDVVISSISVNHIRKVPKPTLYVIVWPSSRTVNYYKRIEFNDSNDLMELVLREDA